jgi:hypothetical protein
VRGLLNVKAVTSVDRPICVHARRASAEPADDDVALAHRLETELFHRTRREEPVDINAGDGTVFLRVVERQEDIAHLESVAAGRR